MTTRSEQVQAIVNNHAQSIPPSHLGPPTRFINETEPALTSHTSATRPTTGILTYREAGR